MERLGTCRDIMVPSTLLCVATRGMWMGGGIDVLKEYITRSKYSAGQSPVDELKSKRQTIFSNSHKHGKYCLICQY